MSDLFDEPDGATPLTPEERAGLLPSWIATRADLNAAEAANIAAGAAWARRRRGELLSDDFVRRLHGRMFGEVWAWAGQYRQSNRNIGIEWHRIAVEIRSLLDDARFWVDQRTYAADELAIRLHHRLVAVHPFANGNGRHSRLMVDLVIVRLGGVPFSWGGASLTPVTSEVRRRYIAALRAADAHDIAPLLQFAQS